MIFLLYIIGHLNGKWFSIQILISKLQRSFSLEKDKNVNHPALCFNNTPVAFSSFQKHLGLILDEKLIFGYHFNEMI